jgi:phage gp29-like protein
MGFFSFKKRPDIRPETEYSLRTEPPSIASHLDVERVFSVTAAAESGHVRDLFCLYRDVIVSDSHMQGEIAKRKMAVLGDRMTIHPYDKAEALDKTAADKIESMIYGCKSWKTACIHLLDGCLWPVAVVEKVFAADAGGYRLANLIPVPHYLLDYTTGKMRISDVDPVSGTILSTSHEPTPDRYIIHRGHLLSSPDTWGGPMRSILYWWLLGTMSRDWWATFLERFGTPFMVGHYPSGDDTSRNVLRDAFKLSCRLGGLVVTDKTRVEIQQAVSGISGGGVAYEKFIDICNREKSKLILGQTLSAEAQPTGLGSGVSSMQEGVRQDIRMWDAASLADTMRGQLFDQFIHINSLSGSTPTLTWGSVSVGEQKAKAELIKALKDAGLQITDDAIGLLSEEIGMSLERAPSAPGGSGSPFPFLESLTAQRRKPTTAPR